MAEITSVALFGASGNGGTAIVPSILAAGLAVTVVTREGSAKSFPPGVKIVTADYSSVDSLTAALKGIDAVVSLLGFQGFQHQIRLIDAAAAARVKYFLPSEFGYDYTDPRVFPLLPAFATKHAAIEHLRTKEKDGMSWSMVHTGLWFDWGLPLNMFDVDLKARTATLWDGGATVFRATNLQDIASAVATLLTNPRARAAARNTQIVISSVETTQNEILAAGQDVTGSEFKVEHVDSETMIADASTKLAAGDMGAIGTILKAISLSKRALTQYGEKADAGNKLLLESTERESVKDIVEKAIEGRGPQGQYIV